MTQSTDYGRPMMPFFIEILLNLGIWGTFGWFISTHFGTVSLLSTFSIDQPLFLQKTKLLYPNPKYFFGIGIWIWAAKNHGFSHRVSVVRDTKDVIAVKKNIFLQLLTYFFAGCTVLSEWRPKYVSKFAKSIKFFEWGE